MGVGCLQDRASSCEFGGKPVTSNASMKDASDFMGGSGTALIPIFVQPLLVRQGGRSLNSWLGSCECHGDGPRFRNSREVSGSFVLSEDRRSTFFYKVRGRLCYCG